MKIKTWAALPALPALLLGTAAVFYAQSQTPRNGSQDQEPAAVGINPLTWEVEGPASAQKLLDQLNTPERIEGRFRAAWKLQDPKAYYERYPKSAERLASEARSAQTLRPLTIEESRKSLTSEQIAAQQRAIDEFFKIDGPPDAPLPRGTKVDFTFRGRAR
jgi:hypothetical protein